MLCDKAKKIDVVGLCWFQSSLSPGFVTIGDVPGLKNYVANRKDSGWRQRNDQPGWTIFLLGPTSRKFSYDWTTTRQELDGYETRPPQMDGA